MFSYRHAFHAGNHADVLKHITLISTLQYLVQKDAGITVIDTHAGAGLYRLDGDYAQKSGESDDGVRKLIAQAVLDKKVAKTAVGNAQAAPKIVANALQYYLDAVTKVNRGDALKVYPGSPLMMFPMLRHEARDKLKLFELHPADFKSLTGHVQQLEAGRTITVAQADGFEALKALLPPPNKRALVLIDPSYELKADYARVSTCMMDAMRRFPTGTYAIWYPIIPRAESHDLPRKLKTLAQQAKKSWLHATLNIGQDDENEGVAPKVVIGPDGKALPAKRPGLRESGMFLINPPHTLKASLNEALPQVLEALGRGRGKGFAVESGG